MLRPTGERLDTDGPTSRAKVEKGGPGDPRHQDIEKGFA
jgi:hypothetical protein